MSFFNSIWTGLKIFYGGERGVIDSLPNWSYRFRYGKDGMLEYRSRAAYRSVFEYIARQEAMQAIERNLNSLFPNIKKGLERYLRQDILKMQKANRIQLIKMGNASDDGLGYIDLEGAEEVKYFAQTKYGRRINDALILYYDGDVPVTVTRTTTIMSQTSNSMGYEWVNGGPKNDSVSETVTTKTVFFIDLAPQISASSNKNLILSTVQGRDFSRKELVSGGDIKFAVRGNIVYDEPGIYPDNDVKKFIQIMQYGGVVKVKHRLFKQFNVDAIIIQDFELGNQEYKNMQPYNFTCVAVEPDEEVTVTQDTLTLLNYAIAASPLDGWYQLILQTKLAEMVANATVTTVKSGLGSLIDLIPSTRI